MGADTGRGNPGTEQLPGEGPLPGTAPFRRSVAEHAGEVRRLLEPVAAAVAARVEELPLRAARGRILAADLPAPHSLPPFDNSQMDGFAVRTADLRRAASAGRAVLRAAAPIPAGPAPAAGEGVELAAGTTAPIMTGAPLPAGADAVVPVEAAEPPRFPAVGGPVGLPADVEPGQFVRRAGSDIAAGDVALRAGAELTVRQLGLAAGLGFEKLTVRGRPRALVVATGDEIVPPGRPLAPGQIHDANTTLVAAALDADGWDVAVETIASDMPAEFLDRLRAAAVSHGTDLVLTSGGISQGAYEVVKLALAERGVDFGSVALQPGGPQGLGVLRWDDGTGTPMLAFPGNPVSTYVSYEMFLRPAAADLLGSVPRREADGVLAAPADSPPGKLQVRRARLLDAGPPARVELVGGPGSHLLHALAASDALAVLPADAEHLPAGSPIRVLLLEEPGPRSHRTPDPRET